MEDSRSLKETAHDSHSRFLQLCLQPDQLSTTYTVRYRSRNITFLYPDDSKETSLHMTCTLKSQARLTSPLQLLIIYILLVYSHQPCSKYSSVTDHDKTDRSDQTIVGIVWRYVLIAATKFSDLLPSATQLCNSLHPHNCE